MTYQCEVPREGRICCNDPGAGEGEVVRVSDTLAGWQPSGVYFHELLCGRGQCLRGGL